MQAGPFNTGCCATNTYYHQAKCSATSPPSPGPSPSYSYDDGDYVERDDEYLSSVTVTEQGSLVFGTSNPTTDGSGGAVVTRDIADDPFMGTAAMAWLEVF